MNGDLIVKYLYTFLTFYTNINILLVIFYKYTYKYIDLHLSCIIVALISFGITYICPRQIRVEVDPTRVQVINTGTLESIIIDILMHWVPLVFIFIVLPRSRNVMVIARTFAIIILYMIATQAQDLYNFDHFLSFIFMAVALLVRFSI